MNVNHLLWMDVAQMKTIKVCYKIDHAIMPCQHQTRSRTGLGKDMDQELDRTTNICAKCSS